jgi:hypothetical protein
MSLDRGSMNIPLKDAACRVNTSIAKNSCMEKNGDTLIRNKMKVKDEGKENKKKRK